MLAESSLLEVNLPCQILKTPQHLDGIWNLELKKKISIEPVVKEEILIFFNQKKDRSLLSNVLTQEGYKTRKENCIAKATKYCELYQPLMVLLDLELSEDYRASIIKTLRSQKNGELLPIIAFGENISQDLKNKVLDSDCDALVHFPFVPERFIAMVQNYLLLG